MKGRGLTRMAMRGMLFLFFTMVPLGAVFAAPDATPIKIGAILPFTGPLADYGPLCKAGIEMRLQEANYTVAGRQVKLIIEDGGHQISLSLEKAKKLVEMDKANFIIGPLPGDIRMGVCPYLGKNKVPNISIVGSAFEETKFGAGFVWPGSYISTSMAMGWYAYDKLGYRTITTIGADYVAGHQLVNGAAEEFKKKGGAVVQQQWAPAGTIDYGPYLAGLKKADAIVMWSVTGDLLRFLKQYYDFGQKMPVIITFASSLKGPAMEKLGKAILGNVGLVEYTWRIDNPANKKFVAAFEAKYKRKPDKDEGNAYTVTSAALAAFDATNGDTAFEKVRAAMLGLKIMTPQGPLSFTRSGVAITNRYICKASVIDGVYAWDPIFVYPDVYDPREQ